MSLPLLQKSYVKGPKNLKKNDRLPPLLGCRDMYVGIMKVLVIFSILALASTNPITETWSLAEVYYAVSHDTRPDIMPYLQKALYEMLFGANERTYVVLYPSPSGAARWTREEIKQSRKSFLPLFAAMAFSDTSEAARNIGKDLAVGASYMKLKELDAEGTPQDTIEVVTQAVDVSLWTSTDLNQALVNPNTNPELIPYLEKAVRGLKQPYTNETMKEIIGIVTPLGIIPHQMRNAYLLKAVWSSETRSSVARWMTEAVRYQEIIT